MRPLGRPLPTPARRHRCPGVFLIVTAAAHHTAQEILDHAELAFVNSNITNIGDASFVIGVNSQLSHSGSFDARLNGVTIGLHFQGKEMATCLLAPIEVKAGVTNTFQLHSLVEVSDVAQFNAFGTALLTQESVPWRVVTKTASITLNVIFDFGVTVDNLSLDKEVPLPGAQGMLYPTVQDFSLASSNATHANVLTSVSIFNPGAFNVLPLGGLELDILYQGTVVGSVGGDDVYLRRGWNTITFAGTLVDANPNDTNTIISSFLGGRAVNLTTRGRPAQRTPLLFRQAVTALSLDVTLQPWQQPLVAGMHVESMSVAPAPGVGGGPSSLVALDMVATVTVNSPLGPHSPLLVQTVAMDVELTGNGAAMGELRVPPTAPLALAAQAPPPSALAGAGSGATPVNVSLALQATLDLDTPQHEGAFEGFMDAFLHDGSVQVGLASLGPRSLSTVISCALGADIAVTVPMPNVTTTVPAMAGLPQVSFLSFALTGPVPVPGHTPSTGLGVVAQVSITNPSPATVPLGGNVTMAVLGQDPLTGASEQVGSVSGQGLVLRPGVNVLNMTGILTAPRSPAATRALTRMVSLYMTGKAGPVACQGLDIDMPDGQAAPAWLLAAVRDLHLVTTLPPASHAPLLTNFSLTTLNMDFSTQEPGTPTTSGFMYTDVHLPFTTVPVQFHTADIVFSMLPSPGAEPMGQIILANVTTTYEAFPHPAPGQATGRLTVALPPGTPIHVLDLPAMQQFMKGAFLNDTVFLDGHLQANQTVGLPLGPLTIQGITSPVSMRLAGMQSLSHPPVYMKSAEVVKGTETELFFLSNITVTNPSQFVGSFGPVSLDLIYDGQVVGVSLLDDLLLQPGPNNFTASGILQPPVDPHTDPAKAAACTQFISRYLTGQDTPISLAGTLNTTPIPLLQPAFAAFVAAGVLPGHHQALIVNATFDELSDKDDHGLVAQTIANPFAVPVEIIAAKIRIYACETRSKDAPYRCEGGEVPSSYPTQIALFTDQDFSDDPIRVPALGVKQSTFRKFRVYNFDKELLPLLVDWSTEPYFVPTLANGTMTVRVENFTQQAPYFQWELPLYGKAGD